MPELPEVETVKKGLDKVLPGNVLESIDVRREKSFQSLTDESLEDLLPLLIQDIERRGKGLIIHLEDNYALFIHLKMTGQLIFVGDERINLGHPTNDFSSPMPIDHTRVILNLKDGTLYFNDQRVFGWIKLLPTEEIKDESFIKNLGPEPWDDEFDVDYLWSVIKRRPKSTIKATLLDQSVVAGIGNIYADEALFETGIKPTHKNYRVKKKQLPELIENIKRVLEKAIKYNGTSLTHHRTPEGSPGEMQDYLKVYDRKDKECKVCGGPIKKTKVSGRGTHFCPNCQG